MSDPANAWVHIKAGPQGPFNTVHVESKEVPIKPRNKTGYGKNIPTDYVVKFNDGWYRVRAYKPKGRTYPELFIGNDIKEGLTVTLNF